jgi:hypothetical protein
LRPCLSASLPFSTQVSSPFIVFLSAYDNSSKVPLPRKKTELMIIVTVFSMIIVVLLDQKIIPGWLGMAFKKDKTDNRSNF